MQACKLKYIWGQRQLLLLVCIWGFNCPLIQNKSVKKGELDWFSLSFFINASFNPLHFVFSAFTIHPCALCLMSTSCIALALRVDGKMDTFLDFSLLLALYLTLSASHFDASSPSHLRQHFCLLMNIWMRLKQREGHTHTHTHIHTHTHTHTHTHSFSCSFSSAEPSTPQEDINILAFSISALWLLQPHLFKRRLQRRGGCLASKKPEISCVKVE